MNANLKKIVQYIWFFRGRISFLNFPLVCVLPFGSLYLAYGDGMGLMFFFKRPYEENEWRFVRRFLKPKMTFFDIGANQGFYTLLAAGQVGEKGKVFSFEPVPSQNKKLIKNIKINRLKNVKVESFAVGLENGKSDMCVCLNGDEALSSLRMPSEDVSSQKEIIKVSVITLDDYVKKNNILSIDFIKVDVEGGELNVLKGGADMFRTLRPILMCEVQDKRTLQWGYLAAEICKFMINYGYDWFSVGLNGLLEPYEFKEKHELKGENLIAVPKEKISSALNLK